MSNVIAEVCEWPADHDDPFSQGHKIVSVVIQPELRLVEIGVDVEMRKPGRVDLRFKPEELMAALATAMFDRDE